MEAVDVRTQADARTQIRAVPWWLVLIGGISAVVVGLCLLFVPAQTTLIIIQLLGIYWLITGILSLVSLLVDRSQWGWKLISGLLGVAAGFIMIQHPIWSAVIVPTTLVMIVAIMGIFIGIALLFLAFKGGGWGTGILGALSIILCIILFVNPLVVAAFIPLVLGAFAILGGIFAVIASFSLRKDPESSAVLPA